MIRVPFPFTSIAPPSKTTFLLLNTGEIDCNFKTFLTLLIILLSFLKFLYFAQELNFQFNKIFLFLFFTNIGNESLNHALSVLHKLNLILEKLTLKFFKIKIALFLEHYFQLKY